MACSVESLPSNPVAKVRFPAMGGSPSDVSEERKKGWRMSCDVDKATEALENELGHR